MVKQHNLQPLTAQQHSGAAVLKVHGPKYFRKVWAAVLEQCYGDVTSAEKWMTSFRPSLGGIPVELARDVAGREKILAETKLMETERARSRPRTAWRTCGTFFPSKYNGDLLFRGTDIPAASLFSELARGGTIDTFLRNNPGVTRDQVDMIFNLIILDLCDF